MLSDGYTTMSSKMGKEKCDEQQRIIVVSGNCWKEQIYLDMELKEKKKQQPET